MEWAEIVLAYIKVLVWPIVLGTVIWRFQDQIEDRIKHLTEASTPVVSAKFDNDAAKVDQEAERLAATVSSDHHPNGRDSLAVKRDNPADQQASDLKHQRLRAWRVVSAINALEHEPDFDSALEVAKHSPEAAVMLAYSKLEGVVRAGWTIDEMGDNRPGYSVGKMIRVLTSEEDWQDVGHLAVELTDLRNRVAHGQSNERISYKGAMDYVDACRKLADTIRFRSASKARHPSRASLLNEWLDAKLIDGNE